MAPFNFKSDQHFIASSDKTTLHIYELLNNNIASPSSIRKTHWTELAAVTTSCDGDHEYDGLVFFDGHGKIEGQVELTKLAQELTLLRLMVSPEGYCYQEVTEVGEHKDFGIHYLRLNDLFDWSRHGVDLTTTSVWGRSELRYCDKQSKNKPQQKIGSVTKEKYDELKKLMKSKNDEIEKLMEEKDDAENSKQEALDELQTLKNEQDTKIEELTNEKDEQLRKLNKLVLKKDAELLKLRTDKNGHGIVDELAKLRNEKDEELRRAMETIRKKDDDKMMLLERLRNKDKEIDKLKRYK
ncbi:hypothetical protein LINPERPRIM_LOCUS3168 [Linum perenne]